MSKAEQIEQSLRRAFVVKELEVQDDSESHRGHAGYPEGGESHFHVRMRTAEFEGKSRIARHRSVHSALGPELVASIHALSLDLDV